MTETFVTQEIPENIEKLKAKVERQHAYNAKYVVFRAHLYKCKFGDQLPRGKFFKGKKPQRIIFDEAHLFFDNSICELPITKMSESKN